MYKTLVTSCAKCMHYRKNANFNKTVHFFFIFTNYNFIDELDMEKYLTIVIKINSSR